MTLASKLLALTLAGTLAICHGTATAAAPSTVEDKALFTFAANGQRLVGRLDAPDKAARATIILVHGYGPTRVLERGAHADLRALFTGIGLNVLVWDKPGCGKSEGEFDVNQPIESSAREVVAAVRALRASGVPGSARVGLWGISRAGWIAPLAIQAEPSIDFWISVSGVDDQENAGYLLATNWAIEGRSPKDVQRLLSAWKRSNEAVWQGASYEHYLAAAEEWTRDPFAQYMGWGQPATREAFLDYQRQYREGKIPIDPGTGLTIYVPGFEKLLASLDLPVLALFGDRDTNVDWRKTAALYRRTIGANPDANLSLHIFKGANHNFRQASTGGIREMQGPGANAPPAERYFQTMAEWLVDQGFGQRADQD